MSSACRECTSQGTRYHGPARVFERTAFFQGNALNFDVERALRRAWVINAAQYLRRKGLASEGTHVRVTAGKVAAAARLENFKIELRLPVLVGDEHRKGVEEAAHRCLIHNTLLHPPTITIEVEGVQQTA
jgi:hypothetical protein